MRIGLLVPEYPPQTIGGGGVVFAALASALNAAGHEVTVVTSQIWGAARDARSEPGIVRVAEWPHPSAAFKTYMPPMPHALAHAIVRLRRCEVVNAHGYGFALVDVLAACIDRRRLVLTLHGFPYTAPQAGALLRRAYGAYDAILGRRALRRACMVTSVSAHVAQQAAVRGRTDVVVINNGFTPLPSPRPGSPVDDGYAERRWIVCVGRLERLKGGDTVIRALPRIRAALGDVGIAFIGEDNGFEDALRAAAEDAGVTNSVRFIGRLERADLPRWYERAIVTVVASRTEAFPGVPLEAMAAACPCVLSDIPGNREVAMSDAAAVFFPVGDAEKLATSIIEIATDPVRRESLVQAGRLVVEHRSWRRVAASYGRIFADAAAKSVGKEVDA